MLAKSQDLDGDSASDAEPQEGMQMRVGVDPSRQDSFHVSYLQAVLWTDLMDDISLCSSLFGYE